MALTQISSPDVLAPVGARSYWVASGNPIIFTYQRKDIAITTITNGNGKAKVNMASVPSDAAVGQQTYIFNNGYVGASEILLVGVGFIVIDMNYIGSSSGGYLNLTGARNGFYMDVNIYALVFPEVLIGNFKYYDDPTGLITVDMQGAIDSYMDLDQGYDYSLINDRDYGKSFSFDFEYRENWRGNTPSVYGSRSDPYFAIKAVKQIGDLYGSNMRAYMPDIATDPVNEQYIAKFLTVFERPVYFEGYPFTVSFLYNHTLAAYFLIRKEQEKDVNGNDLGGETSATLLYEPRTYLNRLNNRKGYDSDVEAFQIWLEQGDAIDFGGAGYGTGTGGGGASTDYFAENYDENWGT
jgi:hypothetical protein